jgi:hypothetical protein
LTAFEYGSGLISIVVGLAVARVLGGIGTFLGMRDRTSRDWIVAAWCLVVLLNLIFWWIAAWVMLHALSEIAPAVLVVFTLATALLYLAAFVLLLERTAAPIEPAHTGFDLPQRPFFVCLAAHFMVMFVYTMRTLPGDLPNLMASNLFMVGLIGTSLAGLWVETPRGHVLVLIAWAVCLAGMSTITQAIG